ncbi:CHAT domain-containing protein [Nostoc cf. edaphicum LEGE 07299]|uniref:CHAT domain-containing protein n=1 Tax=Nostoc cf. edaphicum LEGE 07299 TaxID=2777974 RepID=A0ABR9TW21_9NOSO|nr:CHAT domain-containing protein [Nostoc edaphicum]MBE9104606.1 CHAT domain-containing protein [Nostoc cf. edaphicum LEGE 07299]
MQRLPYRIRRVWAVLFLTTLTLCLWLAHHSLTIGNKGIAEIATVKSSPLTQPVQQGLKLYQAGDIQGAIQSWQKALFSYQERNSHSAEEISIRTYLAKAYQQVGQISEAIAQLEQVIDYYRQTNEPLKVGRMLTEQAQLYSSLGQHRRAATILCDQKQSNSACSQDSAVEIARNHSDELGEVAAWGSLGNAHRLQGEYEQAIQDFERSNEIAKRINNQIYVASTLNGLANTYASLAKGNERRAEFAREVADKEAAQKFQQDTIGHDWQAVQYFEQSLNLARSQNDRVNELRSLLGLVRLYHRQHRQDKAIVNNTLQQALVVLEQLPDSRDKAYTAIQLANLLQLVNQNSESVSTDLATQCLKSESLPKSVELLNKAVAITQKIQDREGESFAKGRLGHTYECHQDYQQAINLTQQALIDAVADENLYLWTWQLGRLSRATGRVKEAINFYEKSIDSLKSIRSDLRLQQRDLQFDFRDNVEPVYRELLELRLEQTNHLVQASDIQQNLESVLPIVDELRLAELQNYLGNNCDLALIQKPVALVGKNTAVLSSILLKERLAIILTLADGEQKIKSKVSWIPVKSQDVRDIINDLRIKLEKRSDLENTYQARAQQVYNWFIHPFLSDLEKNKIETLVFIQDGILRSIPIAALFDGKQFLIEKYAIAFAPALTLTNPQESNPKKLKVLAFGLTQPATVETDAGYKFFEPLTQVESELKKITTSLPKSKGLLDQDFTLERLQKELKENTYPIIHLATHGKFGIDDRETFLVTGKKVAANTQKSLTTKTYNEKLTLNDLYELINNTRAQNQPIELLTLTACETAVGSDRQTLGLAGIAIQAGSQSAIATLWKVDDAATAQLIAKFYQNWHSGMSKAKALQAAQTAWLQTHQQQLESHPGYWAPFILIGNWL